MPEKSDYQKYWEEMKTRAHQLSRTFKREVQPFEVGNTDEYDGKRVNCKGWEMDHGYINQNLYDEMGEVDAAADYILKIIKDGPQCHYCIWNDGGPRSCVHPQIDDCKHENVKVEVVWTLDMMRVSLFRGMTWGKDPSFTGMITLEKPVSFDGTRNRVYKVTCEKCNKDLPLHTIDSDMITAFEDEYDE